MPDDKTGPRAKFTRELPAVRRRALIEATARCLAERGHAATSVRDVCARAGVSPGLVRHYFGGIDALIAETYRSIGSHVAETLVIALNAADATPEARLRAFIDASFRPPVLDPDLLSIWLSFWALVRRDEAIRQIHRDVYAAYRRRLEGLIAEAAGSRPVDTALAALAFTAMLDGLWLELCLDPSVFTPDDAVRIANGWVDGLLSGNAMGLAADT
ncbi:transcriptional regulator BetI [Inquilinus ginsengisoli]|uniref:transcriptional regulator BetI n=1 Tax=Inquilinus ginsengisoli TaxID=363840 RepID=UPI003D1EA5F2